MIGERWLGNQNKETMLNDYREINRNISSLYNITYVDIRQAFLERTPKHNLIYKHYLTVDGEHENEAGTDLVAFLFSQILNDWLLSIL